MITDYLYLGPDNEMLCSRAEICEYVEKHYADRRPCPHCGCYLIPTGETHAVFFHVYRCANSICSASLTVFGLLPRRGRRAA
jgi:hypothetical protein